MFVPKVPHVALLAIARSAFWATASAQAQIDRLAFYRLDEAPRGTDTLVYIAERDLSLLLGSGAGPEPATFAQMCRSSPGDIAPPLYFADPGPRELKAHLATLMGSARLRGSWYRREPLLGFMRAVRAAPKPVVPPPVHECPPRFLEMLEERDQTQYMMRRLRNEMIAYVHGLA